MSPWPGAVASVIVLALAIYGVCWFVGILRDARRWRRHRKIHGTPDVGFRPVLTRRQAH